MDMLRFDDDQESVIVMRAPCVRCGCTMGRVGYKNGQDVVRCFQCDGYAYSRPKSESGKPQRHVRTRPEIKPSTKVRILERDNYTCIICHRDDLPLHVGHLLSVTEGKAQGLTEAELFDDENLAAVCEECNLGQGGRTVSTRLLVRVLRARCLGKGGTDERRA